MSRSAHLHAILQMLTRHSLIAGSVSPDLEEMGGGSINNTFRLKLKTAQFVLKTNDRKSIPGLLAAEAEGLHSLAACGCIRTPSVILTDEDEMYQYLLMEWIEPGRKSDRFWNRFGEQLANLHRISSKEFGFGQNNFMGALPQRNDWTANWIDFFVQQRLEPQLKLAIDTGLAGNELKRKMEVLYRRLHSIFPDEQPALLHGDLWSGNFLCDLNEQPVLIDPAVYYGHRSMDLGMTTLFGGFDTKFYEAYQSVFPQLGDYRLQWEIANLYPLLIHLNLFGSSYLPAIVRTVNRFQSSN